MGLELLDDHIWQHAAREETARLTTREILRRELTRLLPGHRVWLYGSITRPNRFHDWSDVDLAPEAEPGQISLLAVMGLLREALGREVDLAMISQTRLRDKIVREGELWIVQASRSWRANWRRTRPSWTRRLTGPGNA